MPWSLTFLALALICALFGFSGLAGELTGVVQMGFVAFFLLAMVRTMDRAWRGRFVA